MVKSVLKTLLVLFISLMFSCKSNNDNTVELLTSRLEISNDYLKNNVLDINDDFINLKHDPINQPKVFIYSMFVDSIKLLVDNSTNSLNKYINYTKNQDVIIEMEQNHKNLDLFLERVLSSSYLSSQTDAIKIINQLNIKSIDSVIRNKQENKNSLQTKISIITIVNKLLLFESNFIQYCINKSMEHACGYNKFNVIVNQNTNHLKSGENLDLSVALNWIEVASNPKLIINGKIFKSEADGIIKCKTLIKGKPGRHKLPIEITYTKPDGITSTENREVNYTIDD